MKKNFLNGIIPDMSGYTSPLELVINNTIKTVNEQIENDLISRLIVEYELKVDKDELIKLLYGDRNTYAKGYHHGYAAALQNTEAHWKRPYPTTPKSYTRICSRCKGTAYVIGGAEYERCPHCGAKMDSEEKE